MSWRASGACLTDAVVNEGCCLFFAEDVERCELCFDGFEEDAVVENMAAV